WRSNQAAIARYCNEAPISRPTCALRALSSFSLISIPRLLCWRLRRAPILWAAAALRSPRSLEEPAGHEGGRGTGCYTARPAPTQSRRGFPPFRCNRSFRSAQERQPMETASTASGSGEQQPDERHHRLVILGS